MNSYPQYKRCVCNPIKKGEGAKIHPNAAEQLKIAAIPSKLKILLLLINAPHCVCDLITHTKLSQTLISHHLSDLAEAGLVQSEKNGAFVDYALTPKGRRLIKAIQTIN